MTKKKPKLPEKAKFIKQGEEVGKLHAQLWEYTRSKKKVIIIGDENYEFTSAYSFSNDEFASIKELFRAILY